ncbi:VanZ family protein [Thioalkalivibrio sulfidiphilus]|uniref:VanZ family protein n=1 Tax=Thioalkalivibrio sulfidiphilus TaxID=1033854 RepID=UPI003B2D273A
MMPDRNLAHRLLFDARWTGARRLVFWTAVLLLIAGSLMPAAHIPDTGLSDKAGHLLGYAVLTLAGLLAYPGRVWRVVLGVFALGVAIELAQHFIPSRSFEWLDMLANGAGVLLGFAAVWWLRRSLGD